MVIEAGPLDHPGAVARLADRVREALQPDGPPVVVVCAAGEPLLAARSRVRALDQWLAPVAAQRGARVSRSATEGLAAWVACTRGPVGIDVQSTPAALEPALLDAALAPQELRWLAGQAAPERAFAQLWAGKEAVLKAFGVGLAWSPRLVPVLPASEDWQDVHVAALGHAWLSHLQAPVALAVAVNAGHAPTD